MKFPKLPALVLLIFTLFTTPLFASKYPPKMIFQNIMEEQDIGLGEVESIAQGSDGFMFFGGRNGLLRFDGYDFLVVEIEEDPQDPSQPTTVSQTTDLFEDSRKNLWAATRWGLYKYSREQEKLLRIGKSGGDIDFSRGVFNRLLELPNKELLVATYEGIIRLDQDSLKTSRINVADSQGALLHDRIHDMAMGEGNTVWLATEHGINVYDWQANSLEQIIPFSEDPQAQEENSIQTIALDAHKNIWAGSRKGLYRIDAKTREIKRYTHKPDNAQSLSDDFIEDIYLDSLGILWVGTDKGGLNYFNEDKNTFKSFKQAEGQRGTLPSNITRRIYEDSSGDLWVGTYPAGVSIYDRSSAAITVYQHEGDNPQSLAADLVTVIREDKKGNLWVGTDGGGPHYFNRQNNTFKRYQFHSEDNFKIRSNKMLSGEIDSDGDVWFGTWDGGVFQYNAKEDRFDQLPLNTAASNLAEKTSKQLADTSIWCIYEDSNKDLWFGTHNVGLIRYDKKQKLFTRYSNNPDDPSSIASNLVWTVYEDEQKRFWVGTVGGLSQMDRQSGTFRNYFADGEKGSLVNDFAQSINSDNNGRIWVGTNQGLHLFQEQTQTFEVFDTDDGFADGGIRTIEVDDQNNLWLGTNVGIVKFNPESKEVTNYRRFNGERIGGFSTGGSLVTTRGEIIFGGPKGMRIYDVKNMKKNQNIPPVAITEFRVFTKLIPIMGPDKLLTQSISLTDKIVLDYKRTMFSFTFAALNFRDSEKNQYAYKLEGFDQDWREVGNQRKALYTNLDAGNYTFRVKASNNDGIWNEKGTQIAIKQLPPPWLTWWAKSLYGLIIVAIILQFIHSQKMKRKRIEEQNRILEMRVAERTLELRKKNNDIQVLLSNMKQGLFTVDPNGNIHPEYSLHLESIFETREIAGANAIDLLFNGAKLGSNQLNQVKEGVAAIIGQDEMCFEFNSHVLVDEYDIEIEGKEKSLSLDWNPIVHEGMVEKLMVSVRDVTLLKQMESDAATKKRELDMIAQLLNIPAKKYRKFVESTNEFLQENQKIIESHNEKDPEVLAALFRNAHTIKGNCRTYEFNYLSDVVHDAETRYSELAKDSNMTWDKDLLLQDIGQIMFVLSEYERIYYSVLGRNNSDTSRSSSGFWLNESSIHKIQESLTATVEEYPKLAEHEHIARINTLIEEGLSDPLPKVLEDVVLSLSSIAKQLEKEAPKVKIEARDIRIRTEYQDTLAGAFAHILRNNIDHGIETREERKSSGKDEQGTISIQTESQGDNIHIVVEDDGKGLNLNKLYEIGKQLNKWQDQPSPKTVAQLIFESGISTKQKVSEISGRGVGMNAVRQFIQDLGGDVEIRLLRESDKVNLEAEYYEPIQLVIKLPSKIVVKHKS